MTRLTKQIYGASILLGIESKNKTEIELFCNRAYNFGITSQTEIDIIQNGASFFCVISTNEEKLREGLQALYINKMQHRELPRVIKNGKRFSLVPVIAENMAKIRINDIHEDRFLFAQVDNKHLEESAII